MAMNVSRADISASTTSARQAIPNGASGAGSAVIYNPGDVTAYVAFGTSTINAASASGRFIPPGGYRELQIPAGTTHIAAVTATGTTTLEIEVG